MDFYQTSNSIFTEIRRAVTPLVGTPEAGVTTGTGADGTPTKYIDKIAEDIAISHIKEENICHLLISEEAGKVEMGGDSGTIFLDPVDGTYNALMNIPFFAVSLCAAVRGCACTLSIGIAGTACCFYVFSQTACRRPHKYQRYSIRRLPCIQKATDPLLLPPNPDILTDT